MNAGSTREQLQQAILRLTRKPVDSNNPPNVNELAIRLSSKYPQSGMTLDEICAEINTRLRRESDRQGMSD